MTQGDSIEISEARTSTRLSTIAYSPMLWTMLALIAIGAYLLFKENLSGFVDAGFMSIVVLVVWIAFGLAFVGIVVALQRYGHRRLWIVTLAFAWGALAAGGFSQQVNITLDAIFLRLGAEDITAWTSTPIVEEAIKALGVMGLALVPAIRFRGALDGLFYGVFVGVGFIVMESTVYTLSAILSNAGSDGSIIFGMIVIRGLIGGLAGHAVFTGIIGAGVGYVLAHRDAPLHRRVMMLGLAASFAVVMHALWNYQESLNVISVVVGLVSLAGLISALYLARRDEERRLSKIAPDAVRLGTITLDDVKAVEETISQKRRISAYDRAVLKYVHAVDILGADSPAATIASKKLETARPGKS